MTQGRPLGPLVSRTPAKTVISPLVMSATLPPAAPGLTGSPAGYRAVGPRGLPTHVTTAKGTVISRRVGSGLEVRQPPSYPSATVASAMSTTTAPVMGRAIVPQLGGLEVQAQRAYTPAAAAVRPGAPVSPAALAVRRAQFASSSRAPSFTNRVVDKARPYLPAASAAPRSLFQSHSQGFFGTSSAFAVARSGYGGSTVPLPTVMARNGVSGTSPIAGGPQRQLYGMAPTTVPGLARESGVSRWPAPPAAYLPSPNRPNVPTYASAQPAGPRAGVIKILGPATAAAGLARSVGSEPARAVRGAGSAAAGRPTAAGTAATAGRAGTRSGWNRGPAWTSSSRATAAPEWTGSSRATGASAFSGGQSPASNSITASGPSAHGGAPISSYLPGGKGVGVTGTRVAGVSVTGTRAAGTSITGTRVAGVSIAGLGPAAIPAEHWARRLASSRPGTAGGFTTEPSATIRRSPAFVTVGTPKGAAALPTVTAAVAAAGSSLPRSVNPGPPRPNYGAGIRRSPGQQTAAGQKPGPTSPPFTVGNQDALIAAEALNIRRHATPGPAVNPQAAPGLPSRIWSSHARRRSADRRRYPGSQPTTDDGRPTQRCQPARRGKAISWPQSTAGDRARPERTAGARAELPHREQFGAFRQPPPAPYGRAAARLPELGAELAACPEQAGTTSEILTTQRKNLSRQPGAV